MEMDRLERAFVRHLHFKLEAGKAMDKAVLLLASGIFAFSVSVVGFFEGPLVQSELLVSTWVFSGGSILASALGWWVAITQTDYFLTTMQNEGREPDENDQRNMFYVKLISFLNGAAMTALFCAVVSVILFATLNLNEKNAREATEPKEKVYIVSNEPGTVIYIK